MSQDFTEFHKIVLVSLARLSRGRCRPVALDFDHLEAQQTTNSYQR